MNRPNKFAKAITAWLTFEQLCRRETLFCEAYMSYPIGQFLTTRYGSKLRGEFVHPILAELKKGPGDKPRIDFVVLEDNDICSLVLETKWISSSNNLPRDIIRDLIRIELMVHGYNSEGWFILSGKAKSFNTLISDKRILGKDGDPKSKPILPFFDTNSGSIRLNPPAKFRYELLKESLQPFIGIEISNSIRVTKFGPFPNEYKLNEYLTFLWRIENDKDKSRFKPENVYKYE